MTFEQMFEALLSGIPIKRKIWRGYWKYDAHEQNIKIFTKDDDIIRITETDDIVLTLRHTFADDWEIATNENCDIEVS